MESHAVFVVAAAGAGGDICGSDRYDTHNRFDDAVASARWKSTVAARRKFVARQRGDLVMVSPSNMGVSHGFTMKYAGMLSIIHDGAATIKLWDLHSRVLFVDFSQQTCRGACWWEKTNKRPKRKISRAVTGLAVGAIVF